MRAGTPERSVLQWSRQELMEARNKVGRESDAAHSWRTELIRCADGSDVEWEAHQEVVQDFGLTSYKEGFSVYGGGGC